MDRRVIASIAGKEITLFFASPIAYLFLGVFLAVTLFTFFWVEGWFARNVADVRPMFEWMPIMLVFLASALTMRLWSEERRSGTMEFVFTSPPAIREFALGKFLACSALLAVALLATLPLPLSISFIAELDWGPILAGYLAAFLLGIAYVAIGLFISARTDSQIVSLILASVVSGLFYLVGSPVLTDLMSSSVADVLRALGSGSRFESITRGVVDLRDLYYYVSLAAVFLTLGVYSLESQRWAGREASRRRRTWRLGTGLLAANLLIANFWLAGVGSLRIDVTEGRIYTLSEATRSYLAQLREPLLIQGYFSARTHPLLAPLAPRMRDLLAEYEVAGGGNIRVRVIDPAEEPELEDEANAKYGIRPVPFQVADRHQSSLVNSYFNVLLSYGDEYEVLGFRDLIEIKVAGEADMDVQLRNPEYDLTRAIKKVLYGFQAGSSVFANIAEPVSFVGYVSQSGKLPEPLVEFRTVLESVLGELAEESDGKLSVAFQDPEADGGALAAEIGERFGLRPMAASLFDTQTFYFYLTLASGDTLVQVALPEALSAEAAKRSLEEGLKRFATGLLRSVALVTPTSPPAFMGQPPGMAGDTYNQLRDTLGNDFNVESTDLSDGVAPDTADLLMVVDPKALSDRQVFAIDQFLMKGGTVALAAGAYETSLTAESLTASPRTSGLADWLAHQGLVLDATLVMDPVNAAFPVPVTRNVGGFSFQELVMLDYPYFPDIRAPGLNPESAITQGVPQVTLSWPSPIELDADKQADREVVELLATSPGAWLSSSTQVMPRVDEFGRSAFTPEGETASRLVGVLLRGRFDSFFAGQPSPLLAESEAEPDEAGADMHDTEPHMTDAEPATDTDGEDNPLGVVASVIERSPESARLFLFGSNNFLADQTLRMIGSADGTIYANTLQLMVNLVDWSLEDETLLGIRARGNFNRTLPPMEENSQSVIEYLNYGFALLAIALVYLWRRQRMARSVRLHRQWLAAMPAEAGS